MTIYTAYLPPDGNIERIRFVSDRGSLFALLFPGIFLLWNRLWFALLVYLMSGVAIALAGLAIGGAVTVALSVLPGLFLFFHGRELVAARLERTGWHEAGIVETRFRADAESKFFAGFPPALPPTLATGQGPAPSAAAAARPAPLTGGQLGMFPE